MQGSVCLLTVHGIGFQQPPDEAHGVAGYADALHASLRGVMGGRLGEDPERHDGGPVYVSSEWRGSRNAGLARLDPAKPLTRAPGAVPHVALVYSPSEPLSPRPGAVLDTAGRAALAHGHYASTLGIVRLLVSDAWAALHEHAAPASGAPAGGPALAPRRDAAAHAAAADPGPLGTISALEHDVATYVTRNDLRERVRGFVEDAILALLARPDVTGLVVNAHSQGTVLCFDVLCRLPFFAWRAAGDPRAGALAALVTAGSPLRKYLDLFSWGDQVGQLAALSPLPWTNLFDPRDPVADPLGPPASWRPGEDVGSAAAGSDTLFVAVDPDDGSPRPVPVRDVQVDNIHRSSGGGLQAHNYWGNTSEVVEPLAALLR